MTDRAIKFAKQEGSRVSLVSRLEVGFWVLAVVDQGIEIRAHALPWVFEAFRQATGI